MTPSRVLLAVAAVCCLMVVVSAQSCTIVPGTFYSNQPAECVVGDCQDKQGKFPAYGTAPGTPACPTGKGCCPATYDPTKATNQGQKCVVEAGGFFSGQPAACQNTKCKDAQGEFSLGTVGTPCPVGQHCCPTGKAAPVAPPMAKAAFKNPVLAARQALASKTGTVLSAPGGGSLLNRGKLPVRSPAAASGPLKLVPVKDAAYNAAVIKSCLTACDEKLQTCLYYGAVRANCLPESHVCQDKCRAPAKAAVPAKSAAPFGRF